MVDGPDDTDGGDGGNPEEGPILSPEELDIADDEHVTQLDETRFVVSPDARQQDASPDTPGHDGRAGGDGGTGWTGSEPNENTPERGSAPAPGPPQQRSRTTGERNADELDRKRVHGWLRESFADGNSAYGFDVTATFDGQVSQRRMASNDVVTIFESLVLWYAQQIDSDTPVEEILGILLMEANVPIRYPPESLTKLVKSTGLGPDDTIADLLAAVDEDDGVKL